MKNHIAQKATIVSIAGNAFLFILKITIGLISGSLAVISDAINSFLDILTSVAVFISVKVAGKKADACHPFGHTRAEPIAGLIVAIVAAMLGLEIINYSIQKIITKEIISLGFIPIVALVITMIVKLLMSLYFRDVSKISRSPAIRACEIDSRNDVFISGAALIGVIGNIMGYSILDPIAAVLIGLYVIKGGYNIGKENIDYLIGKRPPLPLIRIIKKQALGVKGVVGIHDVKAHYVGNYVHVAAHIELDDRISFRKAHDIGKKVQEKIESITTIDKAFIHLDPVNSEPQ